MDAADIAGPLADRNVEDLLKQHAATKEALQEIVDGNAVICHDCGGEIDEERVQALNLGGCPALRCIDCQNHYEHKQKRGRACK